MLYFIGLGLADVDDLTVKGLRIIKNCKEVYLETYTTILQVDQKTLEEYLGIQLIPADRELVELSADKILKNAGEYDVAFLVGGDPLSATTHTDLILRAVELNIPYKIIHNASIMNAIGSCGLQLYHFGETVSIVFWTDTWRPTSFCEKIIANRRRGLHTLCLLDIKVKEQDEASYMKKTKTYLPPRFMTTAQAASQILESAKQLQVEDLINDKTLCIGAARIGWSDEKFVTTTLRRMADEVDLGRPLHSLVIVGQLHPLEIDYLKINTLESSFDQLALENNQCLNR
ncbi:unnamed protein product [Adineta ricciae]|uniref:diphthine methyl ester synthase n=1 Tax=Adineta ricciae TaxID=249248 RepID=A0A816EI63_ADIRI|nr:unnamed protein product [Adineta ricciae]CAF1650518.1 unnamed protein product [Adineta ricciae]